MRRALAAMLGLAVLVGSALVAQASSLTVDAGVLQAITMPAEIDVPDEPTEYIVISVIGRRFNSGGKPAQVGSPIEESVLMPVGSTYTIEWSGGATVACSSVGFTVPDDEVEGIADSFIADGPVTRSFCAQTGSGDITVDFTPGAS